MSNCLATNFNPFNQCKQTVGGLSKLYVALWSDSFASILNYEGNTVTGATQILAWKELPVSDPSTATNLLQSKGKFKDTIQYSILGRFVEDRDFKTWLNYNTLVFAFVGKNGEAFISGEVNGYRATAFKDATQTTQEGTVSEWTFESDTTYNNYGISATYLEEIEEQADCEDYYSITALTETVTLQEQANCLVGQYDGWTEP